MASLSALPAASADQIWLPGCSIWQQNRYAWRPGYWANGQSDWDWIPAHYVWTPRGYVFVDGYYDYSVARRGVLFAPVYFKSNLYSQRGFSYTPTNVINPDVFASHLFLRPSYGHYYFGDCYGSNCSSKGFSPWFSFFSSRSGYDPFYVQHIWSRKRRWRSALNAANCLLRPGQSSEAVCSARSLDPRQAQDVLLETVALPSTAT